MLWLLLLAACNPAPDTGEDTAPVEEAFLAPDLAGAWLVASEDYEIPGPNGLELDAQLWFPASEADEDLFEYGGYFTSLAHEDGVPDCSRPRPVLVFSHGNTGMRYQSVFLTERLASRGWVVIAPDHRFNTFSDYDDDKLGEVMFRRPLDVAASFDWLLEQAAPGGMLEGCIDESAGYAVAGHSFGGFTAAAVAGASIDPEAVAVYCAGHGGWLCSETADWAAAHPGEVAELGDPRVWASVPMAPAGYEALVGGLEHIAVPGLVLGGSRDSTTTMSAQVRPIFEGWGGRPATLGELADAGHYTFSNACDLVPTFDDCEAPYIPTADAHALINTVTTAFLGLALGDDRYGDWLPQDDERWVWTEAE
jgi:predicted dienelactone hydrolase